MSVNHPEAFMTREMTAADREKYRKQSKMVRISDLHHELLARLADQRTADTTNPVTFRQLAERGYTYLEFEDAVGLNQEQLVRLYHAAGGDPVVAKQAYHAAVEKAIKQLMRG